MPATLIDAVDDYRRGASRVKAKTFQIALHRVNSQKDRPFYNPHIQKEIGLLFHWGATTYDQAYDGYTYSVCNNPVAKEIAVVKNLELNQLAQHLWGRNSSMYAICFSAMWGAAGGNYGRFPVTPEMMVVGGYLGAELCYEKKIDPRKKIWVPEKRSIPEKNLIWNTGKMIQVPAVWHHAPYAKLDQYARYRWDITEEFFQITFKHLLKHYDYLIKNKGHGRAYASIV